MNYNIGVSPFENSQGGPDSNGNFWSDSDNEESINFEWIDIEDIGIQYNFPHNDQAGNIIDIGFDFPLYDQDYTECSVNANGWIGFGGDAGNLWENTEIPNPDVPGPALFPFWDDLNPVNDNCNEYCSGDVYYYSSDDMFVVTFDRVAHWWTNFENSFYTFQLVMYPSGEFHLNYLNLEGDYDSATIGMQNQNGTDGIMMSFDNSASLIDNNFSISVSKGPSWISLNPSSGQIMQGDSENIDVSVNSYDLIPLEYSTFIGIVSSGGDANIPVTMTILASELGDINADGNINVQDIVTLINFILDVEEPDAGEQYAADMNGDGILNVMDVVLLVSLIIGS